MTDKFKNQYRIKSTRLQSWDYGWNGAYFITICTKNRECFFGVIENGGMQNSEIGKIACKYWREIPDHFPFVRLDEFVIMPNHVHGIVIIDKPDDDQSAVAVETLHCNVSTATTTSNNKNKFMSKISPKPGTVSTIIRSYKSVVSKDAHKMIRNFNWQPRFYDRIIRNADEFYRIKNYINNNPAHWRKDKNNTDDLWI